MQSVQIDWCHKVGCLPIRFDLWSLHSACQSVLGQDTEPQVAPDYHLIKHEFVNEVVQLLTLDLFMVVIAVVYFVLLFGYL